MRVEQITWYRVEEKEPPDLIPVFIIVFIKFNAKKAFRYGYFNKYLNKWHIAGAQQQYHFPDEFVEADNDYFTVVEWSSLCNKECAKDKIQDNESHYPCGGVRRRG